VDTGMLSNEGQSNLDKIKNISDQLWKIDQALFRVEYNTAPFDLFDVFFTLFDDYNIKIEYDRSIITIFVMIDNNYINFSELSKKDLITGFDSSEQSSIEYNFDILNKYCRVMREQ
jgi:hypothetical protein